MNTNVVPLNNEKHKKLKATTAINFQRVKREYLLPLVVHEFIVAAAEYPVVFVKNEQTGVFQAVAMVGLQPEESLFCEDDRWEGLYTPRLIKNNPFSLAFKDDKKEGFIVCVDETSPLLNQEEGQALFDEQGEQTEYFKKLIDTMVVDAECVQLTTNFVRDLAEKDLLTSNRLTIEIDNERRNIDGLYVIDEDKFNQLPIDEFEVLRKRGALPAIYAQMGSLHQIPRLIMRKQALRS